MVLFKHIKRGRTQNRRRSSLAAVIGLTVAVVLAPPLPSAAQPDDASYAELLAQSQEEFTRTVADLEAPDAIEAASYLGAGLAWNYAVRHLAHRYHQDDLETRLGVLEDELRAAYQEESQALARQIIGARLLFLSVAEFTRLMAWLNEDQVSLEQIETIVRNMPDLDLSQDQFDQKDLVSLTHGLIGALALLVQTVATTDTLFDLVDREMEITVAKAERISNRTDLHLRGRLFLMTINNVRGSVNMILLFGRALSPDIADRLETIKTAWRDNHGADDTPAQKLAVTLSVMAESSFEVAEVLVGGADR
jgi:hypothetical protein